jgi:hypothetical protein
MISLKPAQGKVFAGKINMKPVTAKRRRKGRFMCDRKNPIIAAETNQIPITAVTNVIAISTGAPFIRSSGEIINKKGTR